MVQAKEIKHMHRLDKKKQAEDVIRDIETIKQEVQKNDCNIDDILRKLNICQNSMKFILSELSN